MQIGASNNAMTEIALALVMAFFSIMVLALIFMSAGMMQAAPGALPVGEQIMLRSALPSDEAAAEEASGAKPVSRDDMVVHYQGRFYDGALMPLELASLGPGDRVLSVAPDLSVAEALVLKAQMPAGEVSVITLNAAWLEKLKETVE
jgi:hypothetical protein